MIPTRGAPRILRGVLLAGTSAALAVAAHAIGGGMLPDTGLTLLLTVGVAAAGVALADRRRGPVAILTALGLSHLGIHLMLALSVTGRPDPDQAVNPLVMMVGHVVAVLLAGAILSKAEAAFFGLAAALAALLPHWLVAALGRRPATSEPAAAPRWAAHPAGGDRPLTVLLRRACARRGPPALAPR